MSIDRDAKEVQDPIYGQYKGDGGGKNSENEAQTMGLKRLSIFKAESLVEVIDEKIADQESWNRDEERLEGKFETTEPVSDPVDKIRGRNKHDRQGEESSDDICEKSEEDNFYPVLKVVFPAHRQTEDLDGDRKDNGIPDSIGYEDKGD